MILLNPIALLFALSIGVLLLLHFRRKSRNVYWVSYLQLWQAQGDSRDFRPTIRILHRNRLLVLQILFLLAAVLALTRPELRILAPPPRSIVLVIDCSASMSVREQGKTRLETALRKAQDLTAEFGANDRVTIIQARPIPLISTYPASDRNGMVAALRSVSPTQAPADMNRAVVLGLSSLSKDEPYDIFVFSDGTRGAVLPENLRSDRLHYIQTGESGDNVAISRFSVRSNPFSAYDQEIYAEVINYSSLPRDFSLRISFGNSLLSSESVGLLANEKKAFVVGAPGGREGILRARIDIEDALDADNTAFAVLNQKSLSVLLVTEGNLFLEKALEVDPGVRSSVIKPRDCSRQELQKPYDAIILDGWEPHDLPSGNYLRIIHPSPAGRELQGQSLRGIGNLSFPRAEHPIVTYVGTSNISIEEALPLAVPPDGVAVLEGNGRPLLVASENASRRSVTMGFDVRASNLPLTPALPVLISNTVRWLSFSGEASGNQVTAGAPIRWRRAVAGEDAEVEISTPQGSVVPLMPNGGMISFSETEMTGVYTLRSGNTTAGYAVNLFSDAESRIDPVVKSGDGTVPMMDRPEIVRHGREIWWFMLLAALALLVLEWFLYRRKSFGFRASRTQAAP